MYDTVRGPHSLRRSREDLSTSPPPPPRVGCCQNCVKNRRRLEHSDVVTKHGMCLHGWLVAFEEGGAS